MDGGAWWAAVHGVTKGRTWLSAFTFTFHFHALEKEMATHSSVLAWRIPGMGEPGGLLSVGLHRVRHDWSDLAEAAAIQIRSWTLRIPRTEELGRLQSMEWQTVGHGWSDRAAAAAEIHASWFSSCLLGFYFFHLYWSIIDKTRIYLK